MLFKSPAHVFKTAIVAGSALIIVPVILNLGIGYVDTIERIGNGEDVPATNMLDAATQGVRPGQTSEQAEKVLGHITTPVASDRPGERCQRYALAKLPAGMVVCYETRMIGGEQRWVVSRSYTG